MVNMPSNSPDFAFLSPGDSPNQLALPTASNETPMLEVPISFPCVEGTNYKNTFNFSAELLCQVINEYRNRPVLDPKTQAIVVASYATLIAIGIVSNVLVCFVVVRQTSRKNSNLGSTSRNLYIFNLAVADLALCCISMPLTLYNLLHFHWSLGALLCKIAPVIQATNMLVSAGTITAIALDRYNTIVRSSSRRNHSQGSSGSVASGVAIIWLLSLLLTSPLFFYTTVENVSIDGVPIYDKCVEHWPSDTLKLAFLIAFTGVLFVIPVCILSAIHLRISSYLERHLKPFQRPRPKIEIHSPIDPLTVRNPQYDETLCDEKATLQKEFLNIKRKESICSENSQRSESSRKYSDCSDSKRMSTPDISPRKQSRFLSFRESSEFSFNFSKLSRESSKKSPKRVRRELRRNRRTTLLLSCIASVYAVSWLPYNVYHIISSLNSYSAEPAKLYKAFAVAHLTAMTSVCINPFLYGWLNTNFRCEFQHIFGSLAACFSRLFKKSSKIINKNAYNDAAMIHKEYECGLKKKTALSFLPSNKNDAVVIAICSDANKFPPL